MKQFEKVCIPALISIVPRCLVGYLSFDGWRERVLYGHFAKGLSEEVLRAAFEVWARPLPQNPPR